MNDTCPKCGGSMIGDGYNTVYQCEYAELDLSLAPDEGPVFCDEEE